MTVLDILASLIASAFAGAGVGGGGLLVIYLTLVKSAQQLSSQGLNLAFFLAGASSAIPIHIKKRRINIFAVIFISVSGIGGAYLGLLFAKALEPETLSVIFGVFLSATGFLSLRKNLVAKSR